MQQKRLVTALVTPVTQVTSTRLARCARQIEIGVLIFLRTSAFFMRTSCARTYVAGYHTAQVSRGFKLKSSISEVWSLCCLSSSLLSSYHRRTRNNTSIAYCRRELAWSFSVASFFCSLLWAGRRLHLQEQWLQSLLTLMNNDPSFLFGKFYFPPFTRTELLSVLLILQLCLNLLCVEWGGERQSFWTNAKWSILLTSSLSGMSSASATIFLANEL